MKKNLLFCMVLAISSIVLYSCSSSDSSSGQGLAYATFGRTLDAVVPAGLKAGGVNANASINKSLFGPCLESYTDCPALTAENGGDSHAGEILMRLWGLDYSTQCNETSYADGTCFHCADCGPTANGNFIKPTMFAAPTACGTTPSTSAHYVNLGVDPCFFDSTIANISNIETCKTTVGGNVDVSSAIPWYASWGIPQNVKFSSFYNDGDRSFWWTINDGALSTDQYFLSLNSDWMYAGVKNSENNKFLFLGTGSPDYYNRRGEGYGINVSAYAGPLDTILTTFEAIQVRDQGTNQYIERLRSNGSYLWYQKYYNDQFPSTPAEVDAVKDTPTDNRCVQIGATKVVDSKYVPLADCVASFEAASITALNQDSNYTLKVIDAQTAGSIQFTTSLTPTVTETSCLPAETEE